MKKYKDLCYFFFVAYSEDQKLWKQVSLAEDGLFPKFFSGQTYQYYGISNTKKTKVRDDLFAKIMLFWKRTENGKNEMYNVNMENEKDINYVNGKKTT
jgi:hypothetical protein